MAALSFVWLASTSEGGAPSVASAFVTTTKTPSFGRSLAPPSHTSMRSTQPNNNALKSRSDDSGEERDGDSSTWSRRELLEQSCRWTLLGGFGLTTASRLVTTPQQAAWAADELASSNSNRLGTSADHPIVILGAGGKVGSLCTKLLADQGLYTRAVTRSGRSILPQDNAFVSYAAGDVTKLDSVTNAVQGASGVIFAASASGKAKGGDPAHVDYLGLYHTAKACLQASVPKLAVISAGTVTRPDSAGFQATNFFVKYVYGDNIMDYKIAGEAVVRDLYQQANNNNVAYTIIRPGGLNDKASVGSKNVHVSQGDVYSSEIPRQDVALVTVAALLAGKATDDTTFELNQVEGLGKAQGSLPDLPTELIHAGAATYDGLFTGLLTDRAIKAKYPDLINDGFRGNKVIPLDQLA